MPLKSVFYHEVEYVLYFIGVTPVFGGYVYLY